MLKSPLYLRTYPLNKRWGHQSHGRACLPTCNLLFTKPVRLRPAVHNNQLSKIHIIHLVSLVCAKYSNRMLSDKKKTQCRGKIKRENFRKVGVVARNRCACVKLHVNNCWSLCYSSSLHEAGFKQLQRNKNADSSAFGMQCIRCFATLLQMLSLLYLKSVTLIIYNTKFIINLTYNGKILLNDCLK